ncbi:hypothetical protein C474_07002 [Halogeometricum pallidum JCM 14848]|uniref:DUF8120 domain-containing protein n=1 Tax=Halogeometricum pallidum JCM 14848 TaxID=1227487 RepID=M0DCN1_HALPD|nr:hypothetical protein [Halogeometricum pallidum]ELZ32548.1 hypothetical protein C474_07002 [Halogeometricum pallidum JCM 14848]
MTHTGSPDADADANANAGVALPARTYRRLDRASKLIGVALVAVGLETGGDTLAGIALGLLGAAIALTTVVLQRQ